MISSQHVFLEEDQSLEVLLVQGPAVRLKQLCDALRAIRGVQQLQLVTTTALLPPLHEQVGTRAPDHAVAGLLTRQGLDALQTTFVPTAAGGVVPLSSLATVTQRPAALLKADERRRDHAQLRVAMGSLQL